MVTRCLAPVLVALGVGAARPAAAEPSPVARAQTALDDLRYEEAAELIDKAWKSGANGRQDLVAIFRHR